MFKGKRISLGLSALLILLCLLPSCASVRPDDVQEYRNFPEYQGYLPLVPDGNGYKVRSDWVLPVKDSDGIESMALPSSPVEAEQRVRSRARREYYKSIGLAPLQIIALPLLLIHDPIEYLFYHVDPVEKRERFREFAGVKVDLHIVDGRGAEIPDAGVYELSSPYRFHSYADLQGLRTFGPSTVSYYEPGKKMLMLKAKHLPAHLGRKIEWKKGKTRTLGSMDSSFHRAERGTGHVAYTSHVFERFALYKDRSVWQWPTSPRDMTLHFFAWAPGYDPKRYSVSGVKPKSTVTAEISLRPLPDNKKILQAAKRFDEIIDVFVKGEEKTIFNGWSLNKPLYISKWFFPAGEFESAKEQLFAWSEDASLPTYFRWNVYELLRDVHRVTQDEEIAVLLKRPEARSKPYFRSVREGLSNPWVFSWDLFLWESNLCPGKGSSAELDRPSPSAMVIAEARSLLKRGEAIDPRDPRLQILRAAIALADGDRARALPLLRYVDHHYFFELYYHCKLSYYN